MFIKWLIPVIVSVVGLFALLAGYGVWERDKSPRVPFVYGLKTKPALPVTYLPEKNPNVLPQDPNTFAVYTTQHDVFTIEEVFTTAGLPYTLCHRLEDANGSRLLFLDFSMDDPVTLSAQEKQFLYDYVREGGTVIALSALTTRYGALKELFGYRDFLPNRKRKAFDLLPSPYFTYFDTPEERHYTLSTRKDAPWTNGIVPGTARPIARYDDGSACITVNHYGKGKAIMLGISLFDLRLRNLFGKDFSANKHYINHLEPLSDFIVLFLKGIYEQTLPHTLTLATTPQGKQATVIMTHDVDFQDSIHNIEPFRKMEDELGFKATYNILVKYVTDFKDIAFFTPPNLHFILDAQDDGFEIGDHTVLHTKGFFFLPVGDCNESYPGYRPFSTGDFMFDGDPTLCGEVKVPKELLLGAGVKHVETFRSGELLYHPHLPEVLERFGFRYSSCFSAEDVLTYFPYRYRRDYHTFSDPSPIWELPLVYEDEHFPPLVFRVSKALELFKKVYDNGGVFTILDHNDMTWWKLKNYDPVYIRKFITGLPKHVWIDTLEHVGAFWDHRSRVVFRYRVDAAAHRLILETNSPVAIPGLSFELRKVPLLANKLPPGIRSVRNRLILDLPAGHHTWRLPLR